MVIAPPGPTREAVVAALPEGVAFRVLDGWEEFSDLGQPAGIVVLGGEVPAATVLDALTTLAHLPGDWSAVVARQEPDGVRGLPLSPGFPGPLEETLRTDAGVGLRLLLREVARARHDINNPLTSALAEVQLLLLGNELDPETRESLLLVQTQLRRIRDEVAALARFRTPQLR